MKKIIVDRIEGHFIVCEDEKENILELKKDDVIGDVKEGDVLVKGKEGKFCLDKALTEKRKKEIEDLMKGLDYTNFSSFTIGCFDSSIFIV